jgi:hypothetical protein
VPAFIDYPIRHDNREKLEASHEQLAQVALMMGVHC